MDKFDLAALKRIAQAEESLESPGYKKHEAGSQERIDTATRLIEKFGSIALEDRKHISTCTAPLLEAVTATLASFLGDNPVLGIKLLMVLLPVIDVAFWQGYTAGKDSKSIELVVSKEAE